MIDWTKERVVVTGGAGFIGSHLVDALLAHGVADIWVIDNLSRGTKANLSRDKGVRLIELDLDEDEIIDALGWLFKDAIVFHLAARVTNIHENRHDHLGMLQNNLRINTNVFEAARLGKPKLMEATSTVCVYPHDAPVPTPESAAFPFHPEDTNEGYGLAKAILEKQAEYLYRELGIPVVVPRFSNAIGLRDYYDHRSSHVIPALIRRVMEGEDPLQVWGSGKQTRVFVDARELAPAVLELAENPDACNAQPVNIGHDRETSIADLARMVAMACGKPDLSIEFDTSYPDGHARRAVDNTRLRSLIGWVPGLPLKETIADMVQEYQAGRARL